MAVRSFPASFVRGGTSNGLVIRREDLPADVSEWGPILSAAMGSPDEYGRQLNGMGSGISSTSKICVVSRSAAERADADVDYTFVQVGIRDGSLDMAGNCGNMSSAVGPFALNEGLLGDDFLARNSGSAVGSAAASGASDGGEEGSRQVTVRIFNTNTSKLIHATFAVTKDGMYNPVGEYNMDGVPGSGSRISLSFLEPHGAKTGLALPTGNAVDLLEIGNGETIEASLVDVANPAVFVRAADLGVAGDIAPDTLQADSTLMARLERIRRAGTSRMGLDPDVQSVPKVLLLSSPTEAAQREGTHIVCRALSMQQAHRAVPLTLALNLGTACRMAGTIPATTARGAEGRESITLAHASGKLEVGSVFKDDGTIQSALLHRTARIMMKGDVFYTTKKT